MKLRRIRTLVVLVAVAAGAGLWYQQSRPQPVSVELVTIDRGKVERMVSNTRGGTIEPCRAAHLSPAIGGTVERISTAEGASVKQGQILVELWNDDLSAQVSLAQSEARAARANVEQVCLLADVAKREADRQERLGARKLVSEDRVDQAVTEAKASSAACTAARAGAEVSASRIAVAMAALERTVLRAPFDAVVAEVEGEIGEYLSPQMAGGEAAISLIDTSCLYVSAPIDEVDAPSIRPGMAAHVTLDAFRGKDFEGVVRRVAPYVRAVEKQARTVGIEVDLANGAVTGLLPGYTADVEVILEARENVVRAPAEAILDGTRVLRFRPSDGTLESVEIKTGISNWKLAEVTEGLEPGDQLVVSLNRDGVEAGALAVPEEEEAAK